MASGVINGTTSNDKIISKIEWESWPDYDGESSYVHVALWLKRTNTGYKTYGDGSFTVQIDSQSFTEAGWFEIEDEWVCITMALSDPIKHNADGSKSITISASGSMPATSLTAVYCSATIGLDTIAQATVMDSLSCSSEYLTGAITAKYTPRDASSYTRMSIQIYQNGSTHEIRTTDLGQKPAVLQTEVIELTQEELEQIYSTVTSRGPVNVVVGVRTFADDRYSETVGSEDYRLLQLNFPWEIEPSMSLTAVPVNDGLPAKFKDIFIAGKSRVKAEITAEAKYGAEITQYSITMGGKTYEEQSAISDVVTVSGLYAIDGSVEDSRGLGTGINDFSVYVTPYARPRIANASGERTVICTRCDSKGNLSEDGSYLLIKAKRSYSTLNGINSCELRFRYCVSGGEMPDTWITLLPKDAASDEVVAVLEGVVPSASTEYIVEIGIADDLEEGAPVVFNIPTENIFRHKRAGGKAVGYGKYAKRDNLFTTAWDMQIDGELLLGEDEEPAVDFITEYHFAEDKPLYVGAVSQLSFRTDKEIPRSFFEGLTYSNNHASILATMTTPYGSTEYLTALDVSALGGDGYALCITNYNGSSGTVLYATDDFDLSGTSAWIKAEKGWQTDVTEYAYTIGSLTDGISDINGEYVYIASDGWSYVKRHSGKMECFMRRAFNRVSCSTAWGSLYTGSIADTGLLYPAEVAFIETPNVDVTEEVYGASAWIYALPPDTETDLKKGPPRYGVLSAVNSTIPTVYLNYRVTGRWK